MLLSELLTYLQNLIKRKVTQVDVAEGYGVTKQQITNLKNSKYRFKQYEIDKIKNYVLKKYGVSNCTLLDQIDTSTINLDYFPDVFGSCGNGVFQFSTKRELISIPKSSLFQHFNPSKQYFVINAYGNSMEPFIFDKDKLVVESWEGEQIIDNRPYLFCYKDEIFVKRLAKNVDQLMIIPENKDYDVRKLTGKELNDVNIIGQIVGLMRDFR